MRRTIGRYHLSLAVLAFTIAMLTGCSENDTPLPSAPDKVNLDNQPAPGMVETRILDGEADDVFGGDQVYPYYEVRRGPLAGRYAFSSGDTVPDGAYVVFKALATSEEPAPQKLHVQGRFDAVGYVHDVVPFRFETTFSDLTPAPGWRDPLGVTSADTVGFEVGPFDYTMLMRGVLWAGGEVVAHDDTPAELSFHGNFPPCVQCLEIGGLGLVPSAEYADIVNSDCLDQSCLDGVTELSFYIDDDPRVDPDDPHQVGPRGNTTNGAIWVNLDTHAVTLDQPTQGDWIEIPAYMHHAVVYMHGKDHPQEYWSDGFAHRRIKSWRYQVDYAADPENALADGGGVDDLVEVTSFPIDDNLADPRVSDLFIDPDSGVWGNVIKVAAPMILAVAGEDEYWSYLRGPSGLDCPPFPEGGTVEEILAWQSEPSVQSASEVWRLSTLQFSEGTIHAIARDQASCADRYQVSGYHYYDGTRIPDPNGRVCSEGLYDMAPSDADPDGIIERGMVHLEQFAADSHGGDAVSKSFRIDLFRPGHPQPVNTAQPPGWIEATPRGWERSRVSAR